MADDEPTGALSWHKLDGHGYGVFAPDGTEAAWASTKAEAAATTRFLNTPLAERPRYEVWPGTDAQGQPHGWDVLRAWDGKQSDGQVIYRGVVSKEAAERHAARLNAGEPEPRKARARGARPNVYPVGWQVWEEGEHFKTLDEVKAYATRLYTSPWLIRYHGTQFVPEFRKQRGQGGKAWSGLIQIGFNGGHARQGVVLHEIAHEILPGHHHDKRFNRVWLELMQHEMGAAMGRKLRALYKEYGVKMDSPTQPKMAPELARSRAQKRAIDRQPLRLWRVEATIGGNKQVGAFEAKTLRGAVREAEQRWDMSNATNLRIWKGRASPTRKPARKAAASRARPR